MPISSALGSSALLPSGLGFRNLIINGDMRVNQRNTAITALAYGAYTVDRWYVDNTDANVRSIAQNTDAPHGFSNSLCMTATTGGTPGGILKFSQKIENLNCSSLAYGTSSAKPVVVSFWVKSSVIGTYAVRLQVQSQAHLVPYVVNVANTWEYKTVSIPGNTAIAISSFLDVQFTIAASAVFWGTSNQWISSTMAYATSGQVNAMATTGNIFAITGVQLEQNYQPTPFEQRPIGTELALCQRYYYSSYSNGVTINGADTISGHHQGIGVDAASVVMSNGTFAVPMRGTPTCNMYQPRGSVGAGSIRNHSNGGGDVTGVTVVGVNNKGLGYIQKNPGISLGTFYGMEITADAEL